MIKYLRRHKKLIIPSGLGPSSSYEEGFAAGVAAQKALSENKGNTEEQNVQAIPNN